MLDSQYHRDLFDETREVLDALREQYDIAIGSTTDTAPLLDNLKRGNLYIDHIFTSESLRVYKPNPAFYTAILTAMGWSADETLFVGDSPTDDVAGPKHAGMRAILLDRNNRHTGASLPTVPDAIIQHLKQLKDIISAIS
jgi:HAD superfamily hydrolase (TIGR01549 family)